MQAATRRRTGYDSRRRRTEARAIRCLWADGPAVPASGWQCFQPGTVPLLTGNAIVGTVAHRRAHVLQLLESNTHLDYSNMRTSTLTSKGQVTIPIEVRRRLGLQPGDHVGFVLRDGEVHLVRQESRIEAAFGLCKADVSLTTEEMDDVIRQRAGR
jgi:AbrB family looped-hinge helix DNA binding protein